MRRVPIGWNVRGIVLYAVRSQGLPSLGLGTLAAAPLLPPLAESLLAIASEATTVTTSFGRHAAAQRRL